MKAFLERIVEELNHEFRGEIHKLLFVFPTKRAGLFFKKQLQSLSGKTGRPLWCPGISSLEEFILGLSNFIVPERHELLFFLYKLYNEKAPAGRKKDFDEFYSWGSMILSDFDEIDKNLVDAGQLFKILREYRSVIQLDIDESHNLYKKYLDFWEEIETIYWYLKEDLSENGCAYPGMAYRDVAEECINNVEFGERRVIFAGFNALNAAEEKIIRVLLTRGVARIYWDYDQYFTEDPGEEAGDFYRRNKKRLLLKDVKWIDCALSEKKEITITGVPTRVTQAQAASVKLSELLEKGASPESTAIVLPDETMLMPLLNALPPVVKKLNVTMGYNLRHTPFYNLISHYLDLHHNGRIIGESPAYYYRDVMNILKHPAIKILSWEKSDEIISGIVEKNKIFIDCGELLSYENSHGALFKAMFSPWKGGIESLRFFMSLFEEFSRYGGEDDEIPVMSAVEREFVYHFYLLFQKILDTIESQEIEVNNLGTFRRLVNEIVSSSSVPFSGEPLEGLQIMGMLETQALDFENIFILSLNEGIIPAGKMKLSFIPYEVRLRHNLSTHSDRDSLFAYHFYRSLKRAKNIFLFYITQTEELGKNEKSRFIEQIRYEFREKNQESVIRSEIAMLRTGKGAPRPIIVEKGAWVMERLNKIGEKGFSPSVLNNYISCPLKFYFQNVLELEEEETLVESADGAHFGSVIHEVLERLYKPLLRKELKRENLFQPDIPALVKEVYRAQLKVQDIDTGKNRLYVEIIKKLVEKFLDMEKGELPFTILSLEKRFAGIPLEIEAAGMRQPVNLKGLVDRIDMKGGHLRIIDYKTGKVGSLDMDDFDRLVTNGERRKEAFQLLFYLYLWSRAGPGNNELTARLGIYSFKDLSSGVRYAHKGKGALDFSRADIDDFEAALKCLFSRIFDPNVPFSSDKTQALTCTICSYNGICGK